MVYVDVAAFFVSVNSAIHLYCSQVNCIVHLKISEQYNSLALFA